MINYIFVIQFLLMKSIQAYLKKCVLIFLCFIVCETSTSYENLYVDENNYVIYEFSLKKQLLPYFLQTLTRETNIIQSTIRMGYNKRQRQFQQQIIIPETNQQQFLFSLYPSNGVQIYIQQENSSAQQIERFRSAISSLFSVSVNSQFMLIHPLTKQIYISNPNDRLCSEQIYAILTHFLPCRSNAGLAQMLTTKKILLGGYIGVEIVWSVEKMNIKFIVEHYKQSANGETIQINNLLDKKIQDSNACTYFEKSSVSDKNKKIINKGNNILSQIIQSISWDNRVNSRKIQFKSNVGVRGNWYGQMHLKTLVREISIDTSFNITQLSIVQQLPPGFQYKNDHLEILNSKNLLQKHKCHTEKSIYKGNNSYTFISFKIYLNCTRGDENKIKLVSTIQYTPHMTSYEDYLLIAGGGEQFMRIPTALMLSENNVTQYVYLSNDNCAIADHLPEPDFSIPFQVIAFAVLVIGYTWIGIWRIYFTWKSKQNQIQKHQQKLKSE